MKKKPQWCITPSDRETIKVDNLCHFDKSNIPKHVRCPRCNKRLKPMLINTEPGLSPDYHVYVPPHKTTKRIRVCGQESCE